MEEHDFAEKIYQLIADVRADVILKKNLQAHYPEALKAIEIVNKKADEATANKLTKSSILFKVVGFELYRLKDEMIQAITDETAG